MNLDELKISGVKSVMVNDSLNAPMIKLNLKLNSNASVLSPNSLIIYVDKSLTPTNDLKTYEFPLKSELKVDQGISDEFVIEPTLENNKVVMKAYIIRRVGHEGLLDSEVIEPLDYQTMVLFEGINYIYSNYEDATIDIIYPKNTEIVKYFLNHSMFYQTNTNTLTEDDLFFKDVFTKIDDDINIDVNNLNVNCITSKNNHFSLDSDGNLVVNTITASNSNSSSTINFDQIYPVGSIYMSMNDTNPSAYFGGVWEQITGYYLYAGSSSGTGGSNTTSAASGSTGTTALSVDHLPSHNHGIPSLSGSASNVGDHAHTIGADFDGGGGSARYTVHSKGVTGAGYLKQTSYAGGHNHTVTTNASVTHAMGNGVAHSHTLNNHTHTITPPFINLFVFQRVS